MGGRFRFGHAMSDVHPRVAAALSAQLARWRAALDGGERRIGWKLGLNFPEVEAVIGREPIIGYLTTGTLLATGESYSPQDGVQLRAETEVALVIGEDVAADANADTARAAVVGAAVALEIVDVSRPPADLEGIVVENAFHRAFVLGPAHRIDPSRREGRLLVNGNLRASATAGADHGDVVRAVAQLLAAAGEQLQRGDHILCGALTHVAIQPGDEVKAEIQTLGAVTLKIA
ncbi:MAG TPA: fumarylacetoacetate hydrolase family protein [Solirubrobacteraceae bacterium]|nr:fumarylacetoacetate hydrolase family protein [Solirubrobacteraceae bacterium]